MHSKSDNKEIMICDKEHEVIQQLFELLLFRYQTGLGKSMKGSDFIFDFANLLHSKCHRIRLKHGGSYIVSPDWIKNNKATIGPIGYDEKCFQYTTTATLSLFKIGLFSASHRWGRGQKGPPSLKSVTHIPH